MTLEDVLDLPIMEAGTLLTTPEAARERQITGVAVIEVPVDGFVRPGELVLSTGMNVGDETKRLARFISSIASAGAAAVALAIGPYTPRISPRVIALANQLGLPLMALLWETRFSEISEAILRRLVYETARREPRNDLVWSLASPAMSADPDRVLLTLQRDPEALGLLERYIAPLQRGQRMPLLQTLDVFFEQDCNASETARMLSISRQSLLYRLRKIEEVLKADLHSPEQRFAILLSLRLQRLRERDGEG